MGKGENVPDPLESARDELMALVPEAIQTLAEVMRHPTRNAMAQATVAKAILAACGLAERDVRSVGTVVKLIVVPAGAEYSDELPEAPEMKQLPAPVIDVESTEE